MPCIVLTGGGTAGHVTPNLALIPLLQEAGYDIHYIGSYDGIEKSLIEEVPGVHYYGISSGKLRRYHSIKNLADPFRVIKGCFQASRIIRKLKPDVVFSKGGFVSVPVVFGAWINRIPSVIHESDLTPGLANKLCIPLCTKMCTTFPEAAKAGKGKGVHTGSPIRPNLLQGSREKGLEFLGFTGEKPVLMMMGGSLGAEAINEALDGALGRLLPQFDVVHIRGNGGLNPKLENVEGYRQYEYINQELPDVFAACDMVLSRAGANAIWEFAALHRPMLLVPLPLAASRGDQIINAESFEKQGFAHVLKQEDMTSATLYHALMACWEDRDAMISAQKAGNTRGGLTALYQIIMDSRKVRKG